MVKHVHEEWSSDLAVKTEAILRRAEQRKPRWVKVVDTALYWTLLFLAIVGNFVISVVLVPFLLIMKGWPLYFSLVFVGASFGWLFSFILMNIEKLETSQHIMASIFLPALALINVGIMAVLSNKLIVMMKLSTPPHNPLIVGGVYVLGYIIPYGILHAQNKM